jgi:hypothetical protein
MVFHSSSHYPAMQACDKVLGTLYNQGLVVFFNILHPGISRSGRLWVRVERRTGEAMFSKDV